MLVAAARVTTSFSVSIFLASCSLFSICESSIRLRRVGSPICQNAVHLTDAVLSGGDVGSLKAVHVVVPDATNDSLADEDLEIRSLHANCATTVAVKRFSAFHGDTKKRPAECKSRRRPIKTSAPTVVWLLRPTEHALINLLNDDRSLPGTIYIVALDQRGLDEKLKRIVRAAWKDKYIFRVLLTGGASNSSGSGGAVIFDPFAKCERGGEFRHVSTSKAAAHVTSKVRRLHGCNLTVSMYAREQTAVLLANNTFNGQDGRLIQLLAEKMDFTPAINLMKGKMTYGYRVVNATYVGTFAELINGTADISLNGHFMKDYNCDIVELSRQITSDRVCLLTPKAGVVPPIITVLKSFQLEVWAMIMLTYIIVVVSHYLLTNFGISYMRHTSPTGCILALDIYRIMVASSLNRKFERTSEKVLFAFCWFFSTVVLNSFQGSLVTFLNTPMYFPDIDTFEDLFASGLPIKTSSYSFRDLLLSDPSLSKLDDRLYFAENETDLNLDGQFAGFQRINVYNLKYFKDIKYLKNKKRHRLLHTMKECLISFFISYAIPKNSPYKARIDEIISRVESAGLIIKWNRDSAKYIFEQYQLVTKNREYIKVFSLQDLEVAFFVLLLGLVCSTAILIVEICTRKVQVRRNFSEE